MTKKTPINSDSSHPIDLDSSQLEELDKLIDNLKKEIVLPQRKVNEKSLATDVGHG
jgi:hypothetical protein